MFLNRAGERKNLHKQDRTFICVPVVINRRAVGSLGVDLRFKDDRDYDRELHFLQVVASMIAQAINISHLVESENDRLRDENEHLRGELRERYDFSNIIGRSNRMRQVYEQITQVGAGQYQRADSRRIGYRQGTDCPRHPLQFGARQAAVR